MAKKTKDELLEESHELGIELDPDADYAEILAAVKIARDEASSEPDEEEVDLEDEALQEAEPRQGRYPFDALGNYIGR